MISALVEHTAAVQCISYSPCSRFLASGAKDGIVCLWNAKTLQPLWKTAVGDAAVLCVAFSVDGNSLAVGDDSHRVTFLNTATRKQKRQELLAGTFKNICYSPDGTLLAISAGNISIYSADNRMKLLHILDRSTGLFTSGFCAFSPVKDHIAVRSPDANTCVWNTKAWKRIKVVRGVANRWRAGCLAYSPNGKHLACETDGNINIWNIGTCQLVKTIVCQHASGFLQFAYSPDGCLLAATCQFVSYNNVAKNRETGKQEISLYETVMSRKQEISLYRCDTYNCVKTLRFRKSYCPDDETAFAFATDSTTLAYGDGHIVRVCRLISLELLCGAGKSLRQAGVAPYVVLDVIEFLNARAARCSFRQESAFLHFRKMSTLAAMQKALLKKAVN